MDGPSDPDMCKQQYVSSKAFIRLLYLQTNKMHAFIDIYILFIFVIISGQAPARPGQLNDKQRIHFISDPIQGNENVYVEIFRKSLR